MAAETFPYKIENVNEEDDKKLKKYFKVYTRSFVRVVPTRHLLPASYVDYASELYDFRCRPDDVWVCSFPRSGTTWLQELVWLVVNNLDFEGAKAKHRSERFAFLDFPIMKNYIETTKYDFETVDDVRTLPSVASPRFLKSHLPLSLLPPNLLNTSKVLYIARCPLDVAVSLFFMMKMFNIIEQGVTFEEFWQLFKNDLVFRAPVFDHVNEAWLKRDHPNLMFLFYEDLQNDLLDVINRVCKHLQRDYSLEQKLLLVKHLNFNNMKESTAMKSSHDNQDGLQFIRKGKSGTWINYLKGDLRKEAEEYMDRYYSKTDMRFPEVKL